MKLSPTRVIEGVMSTILGVGVAALFGVGVLLYMQVRDVQGTLDETKNQVTKEVAKMMTEVQSRVAEMVTEVAEVGEAEIEGYGVWLDHKRMEHCKVSVRDSNLEAVCQEVLEGLKAGNASEYRRLGRGERRRLRESWLFSEFYDLMTGPRAAGQESNGDITSAMGDLWNGYGRIRVSKLRPRTGFQTDALPAPAIRAPPG